MERYLITQSLLSSLNYVFNCYPGCEEDAMASFLTSLRREEEVLDEDALKRIQNGHDFEQLIENIAAGKPVDPTHKWYRVASEIAQIVKGAQFQVKAKRELEVDGMPFLVYGILDALKAGTIFDFKFKNKSFGSIDLAGDYLTSAQHPFYFHLVPEAREFMYLVSDGNDLYIEKYTPDETPKAEKLISEFVGFLKESNLLDEYKAYWVAK